MSTLFFETRVWCASLRVLRNTRSPSSMPTIDSSRISTTWNSMKSSGRHGNAMRLVERHCLDVFGSDLRRLAILRQVDLHQLALQPVLAQLRETAGLAAEEFARHVELTGLVGAVSVKSHVQFEVLAAQCADLGCVPLARGVVGAVDEFGHLHAVEPARTAGEQDGN